jgi:hypothetical protein
MWFIYLDESGDLGFDFNKKGQSKFFTISILVVKNVQDNRAVINAVKKTLNRKFNQGKKHRRIVTELKANRTSMEIKNYFFKQMTEIPFEIFSITLNKKKVSEKIATEKNRVYNFISRMTIEKISFDTTLKRLELIIDKSKNKSQIREFNSYIINQLEAMLDPEIPIDIYHRNSEKDYGLQAADMFSWGIFRKYERFDNEWYKVFRKKVYYDQIYP